MRRQGWREKVPRALSLSSCRVGGNRIQNRENEILSPDLLSVNKQVTVVVVPFASSSDAKAEKGREGRRKSPTTLLSSLPSPPPFLSVSPPLSSLIFPSLCSEAQFTSRGGEVKKKAMISFSLSRDVTLFAQESTMLSRLFVVLPITCIIAAQ